MNPKNKFDMKTQLDITESRKAVMFIAINQEAKEKVYPHKEGPIVIADEAFDKGYEEGFILYKNGEKLTDVDVSSPVGIWREQTGEPLEKAFEADIFHEESVKRGDTFTLYWKTGGNE